MVKPPAKQHGNEKESGDKSPHSMKTCPRALPWAVIFCPFGASGGRLVQQQRLANGGHVVDAEDLHALPGQR